jgi:hypothetical protein
LSTCLWNRTFLKAVGKHVFFSDNESETGTPKPNKHPDDPEGENPKLKGQEVITVDDEEKEEDSEDVEEEEEEEEEEEIEAEEETEEEPEEEMEQGQEEEVAQGNPGDQEPNGDEEGNRRVTPTGAVRSNARTWHFVKNNAENRDEAERQNARQACQPARPMMCYCGKMVAGLYRDGPPRMGMNERACKLCGTVLARLNDESD